MKRALAILILCLLPQAGWGAVYYVVPDTFMSGMPSSPVGSGVTYIATKAGAWPTAGVSTAGVTSFQALWNALTSGDTVYISGGSSGVTYVGTAIDTDSWMASAKPNISFISSSDSGHSGPVIIGTSGANRLLANTHPGTYFNGVTFYNAADAIYVISCTGKITFENVGFKSDTTLQFISLSGATTYTFTNCNSTGSGNSNLIAMTDGDIVIDGGGFNHTALTSKQWMIVSTASDSVTITGSPTWTGPDTRNTSASTISIAQTPTVRISGGTIDKSGYISVAVTGASTVQISGMSITNGHDSGINLSGCTGTVSVYNNTISGVTNSGRGINQIGSGASIWNNTVDECSLYGISVTGVSNQIHGNTVHDCWDDAPYGTGHGIGIIVLTHGETNQIYDNYVYENYTGIQIATSAGGGWNKIYRNRVSGNYINDIDVIADSGIGYTEIFNNTVIHDPEPSINGGDPIGHGIDVQASGTRAKIYNNIINVIQGSTVGNNCQGIYISDTSSNVLDVFLDNNLVYPEPGVTTANVGKIIGTAVNSYATMATWQVGVRADADGKIKGLDGKVSTAEANSLDSDPLLNSDYTLQSGSPAIHTGTKASEAGFTGNQTDSSGNVRYIGPYYRLDIGHNPIDSWVQPSIRGGTFMGGRFMP